MHVTPWRARERSSYRSGGVDGMPAVRSHPAVPGDFVTISVRDTGGGIPAETIDKIFEPFFTTKGVGEGTGLGLSQVFGFTEQSGGEVVVESEQGHGATFTMYLPASQAVTQMDQGDIDT